MTPRLEALASVVAHWLGAGAVDGTLFAVAVWLTSVTLLRRATGRVTAVLWLAALVGFVVVRPFPMHALPLRPAMPPAGTSRANLAPTYEWLAMVHGATVALLLARMILRQQRLRRRIAALPLAGKNIVQSVQKAADALALVAIPQVRVTQARGAPFTVGPAHPTLVLPRWLCAPGARLDAVLLHELAHLERDDHWSLWFERLVIALFFFWPPVRWVGRRLDEARELACDERAIRRGAFSAAEYARHLIEVVSVTRGRSALGGALAIGGGSWRLERRIDRLLAEPWSRRAGLKEGAALTLLVACCLVGLRPRPDNTPAAAAPPSPMPAIAACDGSAMSRSPPETPAPICSAPR